MRAWSIPRWGVESLELVEQPRPRPGINEVLVRFEAISLNYRDYLVIEGSYNPKFPLPLIAGSDAFGQIVEVGEKVSPALEERFVVTTFAPRWHSGPPDRRHLRQVLGGPLPGVFVEYRTFDAEELFLVDDPSLLLPAEWATFPCAGVTAWAALIDHAGLQPGHTVLLLGTGGVSLFGLQIARMTGAKVLVVTSGRDKIEQVKLFGADDAVDRNEREDWDSWVLEATQGKGVDVVLETGGAGTLKRSLRAVKVGGHIALIGVLAGHLLRLNILPFVMKAVKVQGVVVGHHLHLQNLVQAFVGAKIHPIVDTVYPFSDLPIALTHLTQGRHLGKIGLSLP